jgi:O-antigen/teichoic acid export membrane protein
MSRMILVKNAFANVCRGSIAALIALAMPPFLTKALSNDSYNTWLLVLQLATYVSFLDFGIQTAVGRFVAHANEIGDANQRDSIVSTSSAILAGLSFLAIVAVVSFVWLLPKMFPQMPIYVQTDARWSLLLVGGSLALSLPFSIFNGIFIGLQRYDIPAIITGTSKLLGAVFVIVTAYTTHSIVSMAVIMAISNLTSGLWQWLASWKMSNGIKFSLTLVSKEKSKEIIKYCASLMVWSFGMLLVSGLDIAIVGYYNYSYVVYYAVSASLITFIVGLQGSLFGVLMPSAAVLDAKGESRQLGDLLLKTTRYSFLILLATGLPVTIFAREILTVWIGESYGEKGTLILQILVIANTIRLTAIPYVTMIMGVNQQKMIAMSPVIESLSNFVASIALGKLLGGVGVAIGTLIGSIISMIGHIFYNMPRTKKIDFIRSEYLFQAILPPLICFIPIILYGCIRPYLEIKILNILIGATCTVMSFCLVFYVGISISERRQIYKMIRGGV